MGAYGSAGIHRHVWVVGKERSRISIPVYLFFLLFQLHYLQRAFVFPFLLKGKSRMPVAIMAMGIVFNLLNGMMQAGGLFYFAPEGLYADGWAYLLKPHALLGIILFLQVCSSICIPTM